MKRTKLLTALVLVSILVVSCASFKPTHKVKAEFDEIVATQLNTPKKVNKWLWYHFAYDHDKLRMAKSGFISIYSPWKTYREKSGVCFDSANFAGYCLSKVGYECELVFARAFPGRPGHVVCVFKENGDWWTIGDSRDFSIRGPYKNFKEIALRITRGVHANYQLNKFRKYW